MNTFFQRLKSRGGPADKSGPSSLTLAAFGKHPGWDDHIPGIGVETDALAYVKQTLYVGGIGQQIDSGAWEKLESEKRLEGFNHIFLWERAGHALLGRLWSSSDRKGRSKYPMVLCADGGGISSDVLLGTAWLELERLQDACKAVTTAEQVTAECRTSQERLRGQASPGATAPGIEVRRRFVGHQDLGPDRIGLLRILHELGFSPATDGGKRGSPQNEGTVRPAHLRVPAASGSNSESLALWSAFFHCAIPIDTSVLFIIRKDAAWLDVILQPTNDDFFCFQASLNALPLTTAIPYELSPELTSRLDQLESRFSGEAPIAVETAQRTPPASSPIREEKAVPEPAPAKKQKWIFPLLVFAAVLIGGGALWLMSRNNGAKATGGEKTSTDASNAAPIKAQESPPPEKEYTAAMNSARAALQRQDYVAAVASANEALRLKKSDPDAIRLLADAQEQQRAAAAQAEREQKYKQAIDSAKTAYDRSDFTSAIAQADTALANKPNDSAALKLKADARLKQDAALAAGQKQKNYDTAISAAGQKFNAGDYAEAIAQAEVALKYKPNDSAALKLRADASARQEAMMAQQKQKDYEAAMQKGQAALANKQYPDAVSQAILALQLKPGDQAAAELKNTAQTAQEKPSPQNDQQDNYKKALAAAQSAFDAKDYANALQQANLALSIRANDSAAEDLKHRSAEMQDLQEARQDFEHGKLDQALNLCLAHPGADSFSTLAEQIKKTKLNELDSTLELYLVWFGVINPKDAKTNKAQSPDARRKAQELATVEFPIQDVNYYLSLADGLEREYKAGSWLDDNRKKSLSALRKSIQNHQ